MTPLLKIDQHFIMCSLSMKLQSFQFYCLKGFGFKHMCQLLTCWLHVLIKCEALGLSSSFAQNMSTFFVFIKHEALRFLCVDCLQMKSLCTSKASSTQLKCVITPIFLKKILVFHNLVVDCQLKNFKFKLENICFRFLSCS